MPCSPGSIANQPVWMSHGDQHRPPAGGFTATAQSESKPVRRPSPAPSRGLYGIQFHPEVAHTPHGRDVLRNFVIGVAGSQTELDGRGTSIDTTVAQVRERVGDWRVDLCACPVASTRRWRRPSSIRAIGDQLTCIDVDHGLMRKRRVRAAAHDL